LGILMFAPSSCKILRPHNYLDPNPVCLSTKWRWN
jgi:hypothetical protein